MNKNCTKLRIFLIYTQKLMKFHVFFIYLHPKSSV